MPGRYPGGTTPTGKLERSAPLLTCEQEELMDVEALIRDLREVRERGIPRIVSAPLDKVPDLKAALALHKPDLDDANRRNYLKELLADALELGDPHWASGIRLALDMDGEGGTSKERRERFAAHHRSYADTVRKKGGVEENAFRELAKAIIALVQRDRPDAEVTAQPLQEAQTALTASPGERIITSSARAYFAVDSFEQDLRQAVDRYLLSELSEREVFGYALDDLAARSARDETSGNRSLTAYVTLQEAYDYLLDRPETLPDELARELRRERPARDRFLPIRNRVMRGRPLQFDDLEIVEQFTRGFTCGAFAQTQAALGQLISDAGWQPRPRRGSSQIERILHNLPDADFDETGMLGRELQLDDIVHKIKSSRSGMVTLIGEGGIGKSALALEACYRLVDDPDSPFEIILWTSLKTEQLTASGVSELVGAVKDLDGVTQSAGEAIDCTFVGSVRELAKLIGNRPALLVIDNLETAQGQEPRKLVSALPRSVSYLFTSRVGMGLDSIDDERIGPLDEDSAALLFRRFTTTRPRSARLEPSDEGVREIVARLRYSPLAIRWYILSVDAGAAPDFTLQHQEDLLRFCVGNVVETLPDTEKRLLAVIRGLDRPVSFEELEILTETDIDSLRRSVQHLRQGSLLAQVQSSDDDEAWHLVLSSTARAFLPVDSTAAWVDDALQREAAYRAERQLARIEGRERFFDVDHVRERSERDAPVVHLLRRALREQKSGRRAEAVATVARARSLSPAFFEVDRVEAFFASLEKQNARATRHYEAALSNCTNDEERAWVGYFYSVHLGRADRDLPEAIHWAELAHKFFERYESATQLGAYYTWDHRFEEALDLIEWARTQDLSPKFRRIASTSLVECLRQWSEADLKAGRVGDALDHGIAAVEAGTVDHVADPTDSKLMRSIAEAAVAVIDACSAMADLSPERWQRVADVLKPVLDDPYLPQSESWIFVGRALSALLAEYRELVAPSFAHQEDAVRKGAFRGTVVTLNEKFGFVSLPDFPNNIFFHSSFLRPPLRIRDLKVGSMIEFDHSLRDDAKDQAVDVTLVRAGVE